MEFQLRPWRRGDLAALVQSADDPLVAATLRDSFPSPYTRAAARRFLRESIGGDPDAQLCLAVEIEGRAAGSIGLFVQRDIYRQNAELGYWLARPYWGRGVMTRAVSQACGLAFERLGVRRIFAETMAPNLGSRRVLEKCGFSLEGTLRQNAKKNGRVCDTCLYGLLLGELRSPQP
mgnify:CR=1 FL=1